MTDEPTPPIPQPDTPRPVAPSSNGYAKNGKPAVRSGLAHRRNPVLAALGGFASNARRIALRDPLALFLLLASIGLVIAFATLLGAIKPSSSGLQVPLSTVETLSKHKDISTAVLLDHDSRVELTTTANAPEILPNGSLASTATEAGTAASGGTSTTTGAGSP